MAQHILTSSTVNTSNTTTRWHHFKTATLLQQHLAEKIITQANDCIATHGFFSIVLAGGETPRAVYAQLQQGKTDWRHWHMYFGDERCLPEGDVNRNDSMAFTTWLNHVPVPRNNIHTIPAHLPATECVNHYTKTLQSTERFDVVLLGLGEDGHTASLFPANDWGTTPDAPSVIAVNNAPKLPAQRITLSAQRLSKANKVWFIVSGGNKNDACIRWKKGDVIPAAAIAPVNGVDVFTDISAYATGTAP
jgi:6-phosphogluconolactonase